MENSMSSLRRMISSYNETRCGIALLEDELMMNHTSFRIGGRADLFAVPSSEESLAALCGFIAEVSIRAYFLGNGTNVLFDDDGYRGIVVSMENLNKITHTGNIIKAGAGANLINVCKISRELSLSGLEFAYGIPGSVGGAVYMNAGAYGGEMADVLLSSTYLDRATLTAHTIGKEEHAFGYRDSSYKHSDRIILSASFELKDGDADTIKAAMNDFMNRRLTKQPLDLPSAGSVFKRKPGYFSGKLIEDSGLKGYTVGGAQVSEKHAGFIVNRGGATAYDVLKLIEQINETIEKNYGFRLECELIYVK